MGELYLQFMTRELCHQFYWQFENDPAICMDMRQFSPYRYDAAQVDAYYDAQQDPSRVVFMIMLDDTPIGEVKLKYIDHLKKECSLGIHMQNDAVKGKGYGTQAERMAIQFAFDVLGMRAINADAVLKNTRSQHILGKLGFQQTRADDTFLYYRLEKPQAAPKKGRIIFLNGVSSSGKTTLAKALQAALPEPYFLLNSDTFYNMMPENQRDISMFVKAMTGMSHTVKAYADAGLNVIVDHVLLKLYGTLEECVTLLHGLPVLFVHVTCPPEELRRREAARGDRRIGQAEQQLAELHPRSTYDLIVDTFDSTTEECVSRITARLHSIESCTAFQTLWEQMNRAAL